LPDVSRRAVRATFPEYPATGLSAVALSPLTISAESPCKVLLGRALSGLRMEVVVLVVTMLMMLILMTVMTMMTMKMARI
jgi:hypothetical protein